MPRRKGVSLSDQIGQLRTIAGALSQPELREPTNRAIGAPPNRAVGRSPLPGTTGIATNRVQKQRRRV